MFTPPITIATEIFAVIPERFRKSRREPAFGLMRAQLPGGSFIEGPSFDRAGNLYIVDISFGRIFCISPLGMVELFLEYDGEPCGLKIHKDGRFFVTDHRRGLMVVDPVRRTIEPLLEGTANAPFKGVNDLIFSSDGDLYFTDQGMTGLEDPTGRLFRLSVSGELTCLLDNIPSPNGLVLDRSEENILLAVTRGNSIWRVPIASGNVKRVGLFVQLSGGIGPDGLALAQDGGLAIAHIGLGSVWLISARGEPVSRIQSCAGDLITNLAFGGSGNRSLYITESESGSILLARLSVAGQPMFSHQV